MAGEVDPEASVFSQFFEKFYLLEFAYLVSVYSTCVHLGRVAANLPYSLLATVRVLLTMGGVGRTAAVRSLSVGLAIALATWRMLLRCCRLHLPHRGWAPHAPRPR